ncbi:Pyridoxal phosphate-dependent transferase, major region, subdomain 2 [Penicillium expansum]|uniref:aspartate transaminase n=1 Tax=Penicillium expansum TaxID=27334 RepID=A0A0A2JXZ3_PENEN|nr:Pyridoxal phosphate-dependent transferase, major region, subdomain 2 [Penicillium expansum]KGO38572.1 Pyridoxal phosphate-dependent transferase, major region, subdomain 2 [Penicillium expansum]KGO40978.1 Pyridoxal phosphate-dependent transferase, major region, subdomain 2 [Penicillium expansum]KGO59523.1 Pyridoxal phosphate-dependent transferase, major region, subdomain 2 [Penicillium expansum]
MGSITTTSFQDPFQGIPAARAPDGLAALVWQFRADTDPNRTDLLVGVYKTEEGKAYVLPSVKEAKNRIFNDPDWHHEYRPSAVGSQLYRELSANLLFGADHRLLREKRIVSAQTLGASGGCHVGAVFLKNNYGPWKENGNAEIFLPSDTWLNHPFVFQSQGIKPSLLPYFSSKTNTFDFQKFSEAIKSLPTQSVVLLQSGAQNPTGCDPSLDQWRELASIFLERGHLAFFDAAYPGFASGDIDTDLQGARLFAEQEVPLVFVSTYGKAFGLYSERVGVLSVLVPNEETGKRVEAQLSLLARAESGAPPDFGSKIVETVLSDEALQRQWRQEVRDMANQLKHRRAALREALEKFETPGSWRHITEQNGMFSYVGLSVEQVTLLREKHHVYLQHSGRISIAGLNDSNIEYTARSISDVVKATV